ncbi:predicted protein [Naegleria gruberi]|uniref:Predicted protein n=1 Tax=Naegleria gruberi TaxID=5762 RepID=D2V1T0_NAEGR|nr:uncharacterized protein NAEGRDRAFT_30302 [Naegleria gruberi]EFC49364.1 predicted protein [Naegleria gruberi]|eukprot:XP_002682108.1 predicted protein [Naegleria gruberi strain NEG-M]
MEHRVELKAGEELRFEVGFDESIKIKLVEGKAEFFGSELALNRDYNFIGGRNGAIFTYHGATIEMESSKGKDNISNYVGSETPMKEYLEFHDKINMERGPVNNPPRVLVVGPADTGKSSVAKILVNYAVRVGKKVIFVDLDCGQNDITFPGTISMVAKNAYEPIDIEDEFSLCSPLTYFYGETTPDKNVDHFKKIVEQTKKMIDRKCSVDQFYEEGGFIVNTGSWVDSSGIQLLLYIVKTMQINHVIVMDDDRLTNNLKKDLKDTKAVVTRLKKNPGVINRSKEQRTTANQLKTKQYFYGMHKSLSPHSIVVRFEDFTLCRIGGEWQAPLSALPIGAKSSYNPVEVKQVDHSEITKFSILAVSLADKLEDVLTRNIYGVIHVTKIDHENKTMTILSPSPGKGLPGKFVIAGHVSWLDT